MNRTLVLPVWLPHNPKFQHFHPGAPNVPSRDRKLDQISYPFESTFDPQLLSRFVRTIDLAAFRLLTDPNPNPNPNPNPKPHPNPNP
jgi:hypothetical protein